MSNIPWTLIAGKIRNELNPEEEGLFMEWLQRSEETQALFTQLQALNKDLVKERHNYHKTESAWNIIQKKLDHYNSSRKIIFTLLKYAAIMILPIVFTTYIYYKNTQKISRQQHNIAFEDIAKPGEKKARLILSSGDQINLTGSSYQNITEANGIQITNNESRILTYRKSETQKENNDPIYNTLIVPRGGEYQLTLEDGTNVWLNSDSEIKYPTKFDKDKRVVFLKGEAYFEVMKDGSKPFWVITDQVRINVSGTSFNIMAYRDEPVIQTTLEEGSVKLFGHNQNVTLTPGLQATFKNNEGFSVEKVNTLYYTTWRNGIFYFYNTNLGSLSNTLERWYNVDIFFLNQDAKKIRFTGAIEKNKPIKYLIDMIEATSNVKFDISNNSIVIKN